MRHHAAIFVCALAAGCLGSQDLAESVESYAVDAPELTSAAGAGASSGVTACDGPPGLYQDASCQVLSDGVMAYTPQYPLWSDGATKQRYVSLPVGSRIDVTDPDHWVFPTGTRLYKTFGYAGRKLETRVLTKLGGRPGYASWSVVTYAWSADQRHAKQAPAVGVANALGTSFNIPAQNLCWECHTKQGRDLARDPVLGFSAIQLNAVSQAGQVGQGVTLKTLLDQRRLSQPAASQRPLTLQNAVVPGDALAKAALGYMHGNCGNCHSDNNAFAGLVLASEVGGPRQVRETRAYRSAVCQCLTDWRGHEYAPGQAYQFRIAPGQSACSGVLGRMNLRDRVLKAQHQQMPPFGTDKVDTQGLSAVRTWIDSLDKASCSQVCR